MNSDPRPRLRMRLKLRHLQLLEALAAEQSLHAAATRMHTTQPNATRLLAELEDMLGVRLYERSARGLLPTAYGQTMARHARLLLANVDQAESAMQSLGEGSTGAVRIGAMTSIGPYLLSDALAATIGRSAQVRVSIVEGAHDMLAERLRHGELDLVVGRVRPDTALEGLRVRVLVPEEFSAVAGAGHPLARRRRLAFDEVLGQPWVLPPPAVLVRQGFDALFNRMCGQAPRAVVESVSLFTNLYLLRSSTLLGIMPTVVATDLRRAGLLRLLPLPLTGIVGPVVLMTREGSILARAAERIMEALVATADASAAGVTPAGPRSRPAR